MRYLKLLIYTILSFSFQHFYNKITGFSGGGTAILTMLFLVEIDDSVNLLDGQLEEKYTSRLDFFFKKFRVITYFLIGISLQHLYNIYTTETYGTNLGGGSIALTSFLVLFKLDDGLSILELKVASGNLPRSKKYFNKFKFLLYFAVGVFVQHFYQVHFFQEGMVLSGGGFTLLTYNLLIKLDDSIDMFIAGNFDNDLPFRIKSTKKFILIFIYLSSLFFQHKLNLFFGYTCGGTALMYTLLMYRYIPTVGILSHKPDLSSELSLKRKFFKRSRLTLYAVLGFTIQMTYNIITGLAGGGLTGYFYGIFVRADKKSEILK